MWKWVFSNAAWDIPFEIARYLLTAEGEGDWTVTAVAWAWVGFGLLGLGTSFWLLWRIIFSRLLTALAKPEDRQWRKLGNILNESYLGIIQAWKWTQPRPFGTDDPYTILRLLVWSMAMPLVGLLFVAAIFGPTLLVVALIGWLLGLS